MWLEKLLCWRNIIKVESFMTILSLGNKAVLELFCLFRIACYTYCNPNFQSLTTPVTTELKIHYLSNTYLQLPDKEQLVWKPLYIKHPVYLKVKPQTTQARFYTPLGQYPNGRFVVHH